MNNSTNEIVCNFCNSNIYKTYSILENWKLVKCKKCGFIYTNPVPEDMKPFYSEEYFLDERHRDKFYNNDGSIKIKEGNYNNGIIAIENYFDKRGVLLEIGAARGGFLKKMQDRGWEVEGVEISKDATALAKKLNHLELYTGDYLNYNTNQKYDVICMYQTLEHLPKPKDVLIKVFNELKNGGLIVIEVPNIKGWDIKINKERRRLVYDLPRHLNHFFPSFLKKQLTDIGFEVLDTNLYYPEFLLKLLKAKSKQTNNTQSSVSKTKKDRNLPMLKINKTWKGKFLDKISFLFPGWRFTIIARKA